MTEDFPPLKTKKNIFFPVFALLLTGIASAFLWWYSQSLEKNLNLLQTSITQVNESIKKENQKQEHKDYLETQSILEEAKSQRVLWSIRARAILGELESPSLLFSSLQAKDQDQFIALGKAKSLTDVTTLIKKIKRQDSFKKPFVSNINKTKNKDTEFLYTFSIIFDFQQAL